MKKMRIRIHRATLRKLGEPEYIQLLVNPEEKQIVVQSADSTDYLAHRIKKRGDNELYSTDLLEKLGALSGNWRSNGLITLEGLIVNGTSAVFSLVDVIGGKDGTEN